MQRLCLRVADEDAANGARIALEDGLATADFGDFGRLILVRRLVLPSFKGSVNGPAAARAIESSFRTLASGAVHACDTGAAEAPVVWFADRLEALVEAVSRLVEQRGLNAWFWPWALGSLRVADETPDLPSLVAAIVARDSREPRRGVGTLALVRRWRQWSHVGFARFVSALPAREPLDWRWPGPATPVLPRGRAAQVLVDADVRGRLRIAALSDVWKARWVARCELEAGGLVSGDGPPASRPAAAEVAAPPARRDSADGGSQASSENGPRAKSGPTLARGVATQARHSGPRASRQGGGSPVVASIPAWVEAMSPSRHAGFFLLMNAWQAVGFDAWIDSQERAVKTAIGTSWLDRWADRFSMPAGDVHRLAWESPCAEELSGALQTCLDSWARRTRRWLRTRARIGPASLVMRSGSIALTDTHIDVVFSLGDLDIRVRRMALDRDPGWIPWLGRIVAIHYLDGELTDA